MSLYLIIMGVQGAGKGTQAVFVEKKFGVPHVSTGVLLRAMRTRTDELAQRVQDIMNAGSLVPDSVINEILQERLEQPDAAGGVILDGYPRNIAQAEWLEEYLKSHGTSISGGILLELDPYTAFKRAYGRVCAKDGSQYNIFTDNADLEWMTVEHPEKAFPPRLEVRHKLTGELLQRRADDAALGVVKRIDTYLETTAPLIDYYCQRGQLVKIDANQPIEAVSEAIAQAVAKL